MNNVSVSSFSPLSQIISDAIDRIGLKRQSPKTLTGIATGFPSLDRYTSGLQRGDLIVVAGRPSMGERYFVSNIAMNVALTNMLPVAIMENMRGDVALANRLLVFHSKLGWHDLTSGQISNEEFELIETAGKILKEAPIHYSSFAPLSVQELSAHLHQLDQETGGLGLVVIDCLPELKLRDEEMNDEFAIKIAQTSRQLKELAKELNAPIVVLSGISRIVEERSNKYPSLTDLPGMGAIANAADLVLMMYRDEVYDPGSEYIGKAEILINKNLKGHIGVFALNYDGQTGSFEDPYMERDSRSEDFALWQEQGC